MFTEPATLTEAVDRVNTAYFFQSPLAEPDRLALANWIAARQGQGYSYFGLPGLTDNDTVEGVRLFTGEKLDSGVSSRHILGQEGLRALCLLDVHTPFVQRALAAAETQMTPRLLECPTQGKY